MVHPRNFLKNQNSEEDTFTNRFDSHEDTNHPIQTGAETPMSYTQRSPKTVPPVESRTISRQRVLDRFCCRTRMLDRRDLVPT